MREWVERRLNEAVNIALVPYVNSPSTPPVLRNMQAAVNSCVEQLRQARMIWPDHRIHVSVSQGWDDPTRVDVVYHGIESLPPCPLVRLIATVSPALYAVYDAHPQGTGRLIGYCDDYPCDGLVLMTLDERMCNRRQPVPVRVIELDESARE